MLIFDKWYEQQYGGEYEYKSDEVDATVATAYFNYRKSFKFDRTFHDSWEFLRNHPIFRGQFQEKGLDICPVIDDELGPCILLEISHYVDNDFSDIPFYGTNEFIVTYNDSFDIWAKTFEEAIQELALLIETEFGDYTDDDSTYARIELIHGKQKAPFQFELHQANVLVFSEELDTLGEADEH